MDISEVATGTRLWANNTLSTTCKW